MRSRLVDVNQAVSLLLDAPPSSSECLVIIDSILPHAEELMGEEAQQFIDVLDEAASFARKDPHLFRKLLRALRGICGLRAMLPSSYLLLESLATFDDMPSAPGGFSDVWKGTYGHTGVAFKILRKTRRYEDEVYKRFCQEVIVWRQLSCMHPNIVPLLGVIINAPSMVSEWMMHGNMLDYLSSHPDTDRLQLLKDICEGLEFLHSFKIVHGGLKGHNILIDSNGRARLGGFGLVFITNDPNSIFPSTIPSFPGGAYRYMPPELLVQEEPDTKPTPSMKGDIYSLAMVIIELFTGQTPFHELGDPTIIMTVMRGKRPPRPIEALALGLSDSIWNLVEACWQSDKDKRPEISFVLDKLNDTHDTVAAEHRSESLTTRILCFARRPQNSYVLVIFLGLLMAATWRHFFVSRGEDSLLQTLDELRNIDLFLQ